MSTDDALTRSIERHRDGLVARYGEVLNLADVARVLRYPSVQAAQKARLRGTMPLSMERLPPRRGWFATAWSVASVLARLDKHYVQKEETAVS